MLSELPQDLEPRRRGTRPQADFSRIQETLYVMKKPNRDRGSSAIAQSRLSSKQVDSGRLVGKPEVIQAASNRLNWR